MRFSSCRLPALLVSLSALTLTACEKKDPTPTPDPSTKAKAAFTYTAGNCQDGCPVTFQNTSQNATSYTWDFGDNTNGTQTETQFSHAYAQAGIYRVKLKAVGAGGTDTTSQRVTVGTGSGCTRQIVPVSGNITAATTWESCNVYVVDGNVGLNSVLTVQPGTVVKFKPGSGLELQGTGRIEAAGTAAAPIFFTSIKDDSHGGDTNTDGGASTPARKDWNHINLNGKSGSRLEYCQLLYGGGNGSLSYTLALFTGSATVRNCTFAHNAGGGTNQPGALHAGEALANTIIEGNTFYDNELPLRVNNLFSLDNSNSFQNPQNAAQKNDYQGIWVEDTSTPSKPLSWSETEVPYVLESTYWESALTLGAGVTIKLLPNALVQLNNGGKLLARGTSAQPVVFTSYKDDAHGGDTNHDGTNSTPAKKDWRNIVVGSTGGSELDYCQFFYGGNGGNTLDLFASSISVTHCTFAHNGQDDLVTEAALDASRAYAGTVIQHNVFYDNDSNTFHNPANASEKNQYQGIVAAWNHNVSKATVSWEETEVAYVNAENIDLAIDKALRLGNNVTLKFLPNIQLILRNSLTQLLNANGQGVVFTSYKDDTRGGDSNGNGTANTPGAGDWKGVYSGGWQTWTNIYYASN
jgi:PKD repeat protein